MEVREKIQEMLETMSQEGLERLYVIVQRIWLRYGAVAKTHSR